MRCSRDVTCGQTQRHTIPSRFVTFTGHFNILIRRHRREPADVWTCPTSPYTMSCDAQAGGGHLHHRAGHSRVPPCRLVFYATPPAMLSTNSCYLIIAWCASVMCRAISIKRSIMEHSSVSSHLCPLTISARLPAGPAQNINQKELCIIEE